MKKENKKSEVLNCKGDKSLNLKVEVVMKKFKIVMFLALGVSFLVLPLTVEAKKGRALRAPDESIGKCYYGNFLPLDLKEDVLRKIQETRLNYKEDILELKNEVEKKRLEMEKVLLKGELNFDKLLSIHDKISTLRGKIGRQIMKQKIEIYKLIPDDKKENAKRMIFHRFNHKMGPGKVRTPGPLMNK